MSQAALKPCLRYVQRLLATYQWEAMLLLLWGDSSFTLLDAVKTKEDDGGIPKGLCLDVIQPDSLWKTGNDG